MPRRWITPADQANERAVAQVIEDATGCQVHSFPPMCLLDFHLERCDQLVAVAELKCHTRDHARFMVSALKYASLILAGDALQVAPMMVVRRPDGQVLWAYARSEAVHHLAMMPRPDRGGHELCVFSDWLEFHPVVRHA